MPKPTSSIMATNPRPPRHDHAGQTLICLISKVCSCLPCLVGLHLLPYDLLVVFQILSLLVLFLLRTINILAVTPYKSLILSFLLLVSVYLFIEISGVDTRLARMNVFNFTRHCVCSVIDGVLETVDAIRYGYANIDVDVYWRQLSVYPKYIRIPILPIVWYLSEFLWVASKTWPPLLWFLRAGFVSTRDLFVVVTESLFLLCSSDANVAYRGNARGFMVYNLNYWRSKYLDNYMFPWKFLWYLGIASTLVTSYVPLYIIKTSLVTIATRLYLHDKLTPDSRPLGSRMISWFKFKFLNRQPVIMNDHTTSYWSFKNFRAAWEAKGWNAKMHALFGNIHVRIPTDYLLPNHPSNDHIAQFEEFELQPGEVFIPFVNHEGPLETFFVGRDVDAQRMLLYNRLVELIPTMPPGHERDAVLDWLMAEQPGFVPPGFYDHFASDTDDISESSSRETLSRMVGTDNIVTNTYWDAWAHDDPINFCESEILTSEIIFDCTRPEWLANVWNKLMHALNGNIDFHREEMDFIKQIDNEKQYWTNYLGPEGFSFVKAINLDEAPEPFVELLWTATTISDLVRGVKSHALQDIRDLITYFEDNKDFSYMNCSCLSMIKLFQVIHSRKANKMFVGTCDNDKRSRDVKQIKGPVIHPNGYKYVRDPFYMIEPVEFKGIRSLPSVVASLSDAQRRLKHKSFELSKAGTVKVGVNDAGIAIMHACSMSCKRVRDLYEKTSFYYPSSKGYSTQFTPSLLSDYMPPELQSKLEENYMVCGIEMKHVSDMDCILWGRNNGFRNQIYGYITDPIGDVAFSPSLQSQLNSACSNGRLKLDSTLWGRPKAPQDMYAASLKEEQLVVPHYEEEFPVLDYQMGSLSSSSTTPSENYVSFGGLVKHFGGNDVTANLVDNGLELSALVAFMDLVYNSDSMFRVFEITLLYVRNMKFPVSFIEEIDSLSSRNIGVIFQAGNGLSTSIWEKLQFSTLVELYRVFSKISWFSLLKILPDFKLGGYSLKMPITEMSKSSGFFSSVARVVVHFLEKFKECFKTGSLSPLLDRFSSPSAVHKRIMNLSVYSTLLCGYNATARQKRELADLIKQEVIDEEYCVMLNPTAYAEEVAALHKACKELLLRWENDFAASVVLKEALKMAELLLAKIRMRSLASSSRKQPYGIVLYGTVGVGKSELRNMLHAVACNVLGVPSEGTVAIWTDTNFQDTYNDMCITVMMDDIDHSMHYSEFNHAKAIKQCIGVEPQYVESARAEDKGNTFASHQLVIYITNHVALNLSGFTTMKSAIFRRLPVYAEIKLNPDVHVGPMMPGFVSGRGMNIHLIDLYKYDSLASPDFPYTIDKEDMDTKSFLRWFRRDFERYTKIAPLDDCEKCVCGVHKSVCTCDTNVTFQSGFYVDFDFLNNPIVSHLITALMIVLVIECYAKVLKGKMQYYVKEIKNFCFRINLLIYYLQGATLKLVECSKGICEEHLLKYMTVKNAAFAMVVAAGIVYWNSKTSKFHEQMGMSISTDGTFRRVVMAPQTYVMQNTPATWTKEELITICRQRLVKVVHRTEEQLFVHGLRYGVDLILLPSHVITNLPDDNSILEVWTGTQKIPFTKSSIVYERVDDTVDLCVMRVPQLALGPSVDKHIYYSFPANISQFDAAEFVMESQIYPVATRTSVYDHKVVLLSDGVVSKDGDCGLPLIAADKKAWRIVGMHFAQGTLRPMSAPTCYADKLEKSRIEDAIHKMGMRPLELIPITMQYGNLPIGPTPQTSSVGAYLGTGASNLFYIGTLQGMRNSTFKSNLEISPVYPYFKDLINEICGDPLPFVIPSVKGTLDDEGYWRDTFTEKMADPMPESFPDDDTLWLAVADYLSGTNELSVQFQVPDVISLHEAFVGNESIFVTPTNMSTSAGPPFNRPKSSVVIPFREGNSPPLYYDFIPQAAELHTQFVDTITQTTAPLLFSSIFVKDEPVKAKKQLLPRLVNNLPFSFNLLMKIHMVGPRNLLRRFPVHYECMVGINIGSNHVCRITGNLIDKGGKTRTFEYDYMWFDLTQRGLINFHVANVFYGLGFNSSGPLKAKLLHNLVISIFKTIFCFKGDLVTFGCRNVSGGDATTEINSITNSIALRYAYYRSTGVAKGLKEWIRNYKLNFFTKPIVVLPTGIVPFRSVIAVSTYGDDGVAASKLDIGTWLNKYVAELGLCITDGRDKSPIVKQRPLDECTFLKRQFTYDPELEYMLMPLKKEAIMRMVMYLLPSSLTKIDHIATVCNDVLKEASLHGEEFYNQVAVIVLRASVAEKFSESAYLRVKTFKERREELLAGDFVTWSRGMENGINM